MCTVSRRVGAVKASDLIIFNIIMKPVVIVKALPHTFVTFLIGAISGVAFSKEGALRAGRQNFTFIWNATQKFLIAENIYREKQVLWWEKFFRAGKKFFRVYKGPLLGEKIPVPKKWSPKIFTFWHPKRMRGGKFKIRLRQVITTNILT